MQVDCQMEWQSTCYAAYKSLALPQGFCYHIAVISDPVPQELELPLKFFLCFLAAFATTCAFAQGGQISPEEIRSLELSPAVVFISVEYRVTGIIPQPGPDKHKLIEGTLGETGSGFL